MARALVIGTAGHIDHGKSALVRALTGIDPDRLKEEQERGITIELGFAYTAIGDLTVAFVDVPGHERFVRTMLAGAGGVDAVLLVIAADESIKPQTREHFDICRLLAIPRGIIVITKTDAADAEMVELASLEARELVAGSMLADAPLVAVSAHTGDGLDQLRAAIANLASDASGQDSRGPVRLPIDRAFSVRGFGTVVTGTLGDGVINVGDSLEILPTLESVRVRGLHVHNKAAETVIAPSRVAVNLGGIDLDHVSRGMTLAAAGSLAVTRRVDVRLELLPDALPLRHGARVRVYQGTSEVVARVTLSAVRSRALRLPDRSRAARLPDRSHTPGPTEASREHAATEADWTRIEAGVVDAAVPSGGEALARLRLMHPTVLTHGDRLVIRAVSPAVTIGGAVVLDPEPPSGGVRRVRAADRLKVLTTSNPVSWADAVLVDAGIRGLTTGDLARRGGLRFEDARAVVHALVTRGAAMRAGDAVVNADAAATARRSIVRLLTAFHRSNPEEPGMPREMLREQSRVGPKLEALLLGLGQIVTGSDRLALASHKPAVGGDDERVRAAVETILQKSGVQPPDVPSLAATAGTTPAIVQKALVALVKAGRVQRLDLLWFHTATLDALKAQVKGLGAGAVFDVATAKTRFGVSRKFAIPLLEYLDRERITRRVGDRRVVI